MPRVWDEWAFFFFIALQCLEQLETQREGLKCSILQARMERPKYTKEEIIQWISKYRYGNIDDADYRKEIIDTFLNSIYVYDDRLVFTCNYRDGTETLTLKDIEAVFGSDLKNCAPPNEPLHEDAYAFSCKGFSVGDVCWLNGKNNRWIFWKS